MKGFLGPVTALLRGCNFTIFRLRGRLIETGFMGAHVCESRLLQSPRLITHEGALHRKGTIAPDLLLLEFRLAEMTDFKKSGFFMC